MVNGLGHCHVYLWHSCDRSTARLVGGNRNRAGLVNSLRRRLPLNLRLSLPQHRRISVASAFGDRLWICWHLHVDASALGCDLSHVCSSDLFSGRRSGGDRFLL